MLDGQFRYHEWTTKADADSVFSSLEKLARADFVLLYNVCSIYIYIYMICNFCLLAAQLLNSRIPYILGFQICTPLDNPRIPSCAHMCFAPLVFSRSSSRTGSASPCTTTSPAATTRRALAVFWLIGLRPCKQGNDSGLWLEHAAGVSQGAEVSWRCWGWLGHSSAAGRSPDQRVGATKREACTWNKQYTIH